MTAGVRQEPREAVRPRTPRRPRLPVLLALLVGLAGVGHRLALLLADAPPTNSDEATMGLAALHIARGADFPVWFYGQAYMGTLEAYLAAPLLALTGPSTLALRVPTLALYALFLALSWRLARRLGGDPWFALLVVALLALGSDRVVKNQLIAGGGYPELNPAGAALALLTVGLCAAGPARRLPRWAAWGTVSGLMLWVDPLILPYVLGTGAVLVVARRRELAGRAGLVAAGTLLLGAAPMLWDSLRHGRDPLAAVLAAGGGTVPVGWGERLHGGLVLGPPLGTGFCDPGRCADWQLWWAVAYPVLLVLAVATAWRTLRGRLSPPALAPDGTSPGPGGVRADDGAVGGPEPADRWVSAAVRLALLAGSVGVLAAYTVSRAAGSTPVESSRYLSCLAVATPALLWPLWRAARRAVPAGRGDRAGGRWARVAGLVAVGLLAGMFATAGAATAGAVRTVPATHAEADRHRALVDELRTRGVRHVRAGYWTCNRLTYATGEQVVCAVVDDEQRPGFDRLPRYRRAVAADPTAAWVAPAGSPLAARLDSRLGPEPGALDLVEVPGWRIYLPRR
ncbi:hypothetical protein [Micromonospora auratinigra]|nr:hypothetical protein [Micromonospora auratinigra]